MADNKPIPIVVFMLASLLAIGTSSVAAQAKNEGLAPGLYPALSAAAVHDDNIMRTDTNEISDYFIVAAPSLKYRTMFKKHFLALSYFGAYTKFIDNTGENYIDHDLETDAFLDLSPRLNLNLGGGYVWSHDARGASSANLVQSVEPDRWEDSHISGEIIYGHPESQARLGLSASSATREYINNNQQGRDRNSNRVTGTFYFNTSAKTTWLVKASLSKIDYIYVQTINLDSTETSYLTGAKWEATGQTTGTMMFGYLKKDLDSITQSDFSGATVSGEISWQPRPVDRFTLTLQRSANESSQATASYYLKNYLSVSWEHMLTELASIDANANVQKDDYSDNRADELRMFSIRLRYSLSRLLNFDLKYARTARDSNESGAIFDNNIIMLSLGGAAQ